MTETSNYLALAPKLYPVPEGYTEVPGYPFFAVTECGKVWNRRSNIQCTISTLDTGYKVVGLNWMGKVITRYVHRLVALALIPVPEHLKKELKIEVNHKDCNKENNAKSNLEWVTPKQNIRHAYESGQYKGKKLLEGTSDKPFLSVAVQVRNTKTNKVVEFPSIEACASVYGMNRKRLARHLESKKAGMLTKNWNVFRKASDESWPHIPEDRLIENRWDQPHGMYFVQHIETGIIGFSETARKLAEVSNIPYNTIQSVLRTDGKKYKIANHYFWYDDYPIAALMKKSVYKKEHKFRKTITLRIKNKQTGAISEFKSLRSLAKFLNVVPNTLDYNIKNWGCFGDYFIKHVTQ